MSTESAAKLGFTFKDTDEINSVEILWQNRARRRFFVNRSGTLECDSFGEPHLIPDLTFRSIRDLARTRLLDKLRQLDAERQFTEIVVGDLKRRVPILNYQSDSRLARLVVNEARLIGIDVRIALDFFFEKYYPEEWWRKFRILNLLFGMGAIATL